jgi:hypothetical protein
MTKDKSETGANRALTDTARMRLPAFVDPLEQTQPMPVAERRGRAHEGRYMHEQLRGEGHARAMLNNPVYRAQEINAGLRSPDFRDGDDPTRDWFTNVTRNGCRDES